MPAAIKKPNQKGEWQCATCKEWKPPTSYNKNKKQKSGLHYACRECSKKHIRKYNLPAKYNITIEKYDSLLAEQLSKCAICNSSLVDGSDKYNERPVVDHNHSTGEVRQLLCSKCNLALGNMNDSSEYAYKLYQYLTKWNC